MSQSWFRIALADGKTPVLVVAPGEFLGDAIDVAVRRVGKDVWPIAAAAASAGDVPLGESVGKGVVVERGPAPDVPIGMRWPSGIVPSLEEAAQAATLVEGWTHRAIENLVVIEAQLSGERITETFLELVERLPVADNLEVKVLAHYDDAATTEVWLSPHLDTRRAIRFLDDHDVELIENGHVELSLYLRGERSTLRLTEHKTLVWMSEDASTADRVIGWMADLAIPHRDGLTTLAELDHFHFRPSRSSRRAKLLDRLRRLRLRKVDAWSGAA